MTGSGTKYDPFICETWSELTSVTGYEHQSYVKMADKIDPADKIIDLAEIQPYGFTKTVRLYGFIDFNGWTLKNFYSTATQAIEVGKGHTTGRTTWENLNMLNFYHSCHVTSDTQYAVPYFIYVEEAAGENHSISNCDFYGELNYDLNAFQINKGNFIATSSAYGWGTPCMNLNKCGFNIKAKCNTLLHLFNVSDILKCNIKLDINSRYNYIIADKSSDYGEKVRIHNCRFAGNIENSDTSKNTIISGDLSSFNVFDIETNAPIEYTGGGVSIYNSDKASSATLNSTFVGCQTSQLEDPEFLERIGFPCEKKEVENGNS